MDEVRRLFTEKKPEFAVEADLLLKEFKSYLKINNLVEVRLIHAYDIEGINEEIYEKVKITVLSDPVVDIIYDEELHINKNERYFAVEFLPGQYDQKADFAAQCIQVFTLDARPIVKTFDVIMLKGDISDGDFEKIKSYYINPVEIREISLRKPETLKEVYSEPDRVEILEDFIEDKDIELTINKMGLAMTKEDLLYCRDYFKCTEKRNPTITEIKVIDTYWSDHCRHTTFNTIIDKVFIEDSLYKKDIEDAFEKYREARSVVYKEKNKEICLMDMAQMAMREMRVRGKLKDLEESEEINAASIEIDADIDGKTEKWLVMFKNETHNHPTEIEPFGGAATCLGGAIRDPLSGRSYVYGAIRITGCGDPRTSFEETLPGKLPQRKITATAALGYSSYGSQIGIPAGQVTEIYHEGFVAKRMELGAVVAAAPRENVVREKPVPGDVVILLGGRTGRDGCGGATGSSKEHDEESFIKSGAEVQKGNAAIEGYIQRLFRKPNISKMIKKCNDFGAGGVSVAVGELADSLYIDLDKVPVKYNGLDGTELAISESQERMAVVISHKDKDTFIKYANEENLEATKIAEVTDTGRLVMVWKGNTIVDIKRDFLDSNGIRQRTNVYVEAPGELDCFFDDELIDSNNIKKRWLENLKQLNVCSQKGLVDKFDSTAGGNTVLMPFGGKFQDSPAEGLLMKLPLVNGNTVTATAMTYGYNPYLSSLSPFHGGLYAVIHSVSKIVAMGGEYNNIRLTMQEYFEKLGEDERKWGKPFVALLGAYDGQKGLNLPAIGGKDSMSGTFMDIHVPPTLVSFALTTMDVNNAKSGEFKEIGSKIVYLPIRKNERYMPDFEYLKSLYDKIHKLIISGAVISASTTKAGGIASELTKMSFGNRIGLKIQENLELSKFFQEDLGSFILELRKDFDFEKLKGFDYKLLAETIDEEIIKAKDFTIILKEAYDAWMEPLEEIFPGKIIDRKESKIIEYKSRSAKNPKSKAVKPKVLIPVFPGTNCENEIRRAFEKAGALVDILIIRNLTKEYIGESIKEFSRRILNSQIIALAGSFGGGNDPYGATNFITAMMNDESVKESVTDFLENKAGLILGIDNGFHALIKTGLLPYGEIKRVDENGLGLTINEKGRHISAMAAIKITSVLSPWMTYSQVGDIYNLPVAYKVGRLAAKDYMIKDMEGKGQIAAQYVIDNQKGSAYGVGAITSPDGRILGMMAHPERLDDYVAINVPGNKRQSIFKAGVDYFI